MDADGLTEEKFLAMAKKLAEAVKKSDAKLMEAVKKMIETSKNSTDKMTSDNELTKSELKALVKKEVSNMLQSFDNKNKELDNFVSEIKNGENGKDADEETIIENVLGRIRIPEIKELANDMPKLGTNIRDSIELLQGNERPGLSLIKGLRTILNKIDKDLRKLKNRPFRIEGGGGLAGGGGRIVKSYDLSDSLNGVLKTFSLPSFWRIITVQSSSFPNAFRPTTDYTVDIPNSKITFTSEITADTTLATGQTIIITYSE